MANTVHRSTVWVAALFVALTLVATFPIVEAPGSYAYFDHADAQLNMWIMSWDAHQLTRDPLHLFDANIFYPARGTLTYSEPLLGYLPLFGPIRWLGGSPALAFNVTLLFSFAASGLCMYLLAFHMTSRRWPSVLAGIVYAFVPYRFVHIPQIQLESMEWIPLAFLFLHLLVEDGRLRYACALAAMVVMQTLCCAYYGVFLATALALASVTLIVVDRRARQPKVIVGIMLAGALSILLLTPMADEYLRVHQPAGLARSYAEIVARAADATSYGASTAPFHQAILGQPLPPPRDYLFPGFFALAFAVGGAIAVRRRPAALIYLVIAVFGGLASFGPNGILGVSVYGPLEHAIPVFTALRQISRFGVLVLFAVSVLAAFGGAALESRLPRHAGRWMAVVAALAFLETFSAPLRLDRPGGVGLTQVPDTPDVYRWIASQPGHFSILELPLPPVHLLWQNASYVYWSTAHWHPLVNGYSGFASPDYSSLRQILTGFPDDRSRDALAERDVRYVLIHWNRYRATDVPIDTASLARTGWLSRAAQFSDADVYELQGPTESFTSARQPRP